MTGPAPTTNADDMAAPPSEEARDGLVVHAFFVLFVVLVAAFIAWAYYGRLDIVANAHGEVIPSSQVKKVQHLEGGIVRKILVHEGERVTAGQPLVSLEPTRSSADVDELRLRLAGLKADIARLEAERSGADAPAFPDDLVAAHPNLVESARGLFDARRARFATKLKSAQEKVTEEQQRAAEIETRIANNQKRLKLLREQVKISEGLMQDQLTNRMRHLDLLRTEARLEGKIAEDRKALPRTRAARDGALADLQGVKDQREEDVRTELEQSRRLFGEYSQRISKYEDSLKRTVLRAPVDGVVKTLYVTTRGGVVQPGGTVAEVVPIDDRLVIKAQLPTGDVGYVSTGQTAKIRLASADAIRFGHITGKVVNVSPDTLQTRKGMPFYEVRIETKADRFERDGVAFRLVPGVRVTCAIVTGERSVMSYLLDPFVGSMETAFRER